MGNPTAPVLSHKASEAITSTIRHDFIPTSRSATRKTVTGLTLNSDVSLTIQEMYTERFCASNRFITRFMKQHRLSLSTPNSERRTDVDEYDIHGFLLSLKAE
jgi:hypothetical protein